jgi:hypothetical protein
MLSVRLVGNIENGQTKIEITGSLEFLRNCSPVLAKRKLKFLFSGFDNCLSFYFGNAQLADFTLDVIDLTKDRIAGALPPFSVPTSMLVPMPQPSVSPEACSQANCGVARSYSTVSILS